VENKLLLFINPDFHCLYDDEQEKEEEGCNYLIPSPPTISLSQNFIG